MTTVICDLDGVVYRGDSAVPGSAEALRRFNDQGVRVVFVTNNSTRSPEESANKIERVTGVSVAPDDICTSASATASNLEREDQPVFVVGEEGIRQAVESAGLEITADHTVAQSVVVGLFRGMTYDVIDRAAAAVRNGARFVATNVDATYPTADGIKPGSGALVAAISAVAGRPPEVCGKPHPAMRSLIRERGVEDAWVIGDRVDTDIALAAGEENWRSILVLTGVTRRGDPTGEADHVVPDLASAVDVVLSMEERR